MFKTITMPHSISLSGLGKQRIVAFVKRVKHSKDSKDNQDNQGIPKAFVGPDFTCNHLKELCEKDEATHFEDMKKQLTNLYGAEMANEVTSPFLADSVLFLHEHYFLNKNANVKNLRKFAMRLYKLEKPMPPKVHEAIMDILNKCDAM